MTRAVPTKQRRLTPATRQPRCFVVGVDETECATPGPHVPGEAGKPAHRRRCDGTPSDAPVRGDPHPRPFDAQRSNSAPYVGGCGPQRGVASVAVAGPGIKTGAATTTCRRSFLGDHKGRIDTGGFLLPRKVWPPSGSLARPAWPGGSPANPCSLVWATPSVPSHVSAPAGRPTPRRERTQGPFGRSRMEDVRSASAKREGSLGRQGCRKTAAQPVGRPSTTIGRSKGREGRAGQATWHKSREWGSVTEYHQRVIECDPTTD